MRYSHSFATYPIGFKGFVVSPTKICLQFSEPQIKLRINSGDSDKLKKLPNNHKYLEVPDNGVDISILAVGCQMPVIEQYQLALIDAYAEYFNLHEEKYREVYKKDFRDFLLKLDNKLSKLLMRL